MPSPIAGQLPDMFQSAGRCVRKRAWTVPVSIESSSEKGRAPTLGSTNLTAHEWPEVLIAPTGSGKTAAITLGWAAHRMRAPEDDAEAACLVPADAHIGRSDRPFGQGVVREAETGGNRQRRRASPTRRCPRAHGRVLSRHAGSTVLNGPRSSSGRSLLLSRALMRGYASSRAVWPMEFALLHEDAQWVFDEVQLMARDARPRPSSKRFGAARPCAPGAMAARRAALRAACGISATLDPAWLRTVDYSSPAEGDDRLWKVVPRPETIGSGGSRPRGRPWSRENAAPATARTADIAVYVGQLADPCSPRTGPAV